MCACACVCACLAFMCAHKQNMLSECKRKVNTQKTQITMWNNYHLLPISVRDVLKS